jgi:hypothetical protein
MSSTDNVVEFIALDIAGVAIRQGDLVLVESTGRDSDFGSDWVGKLAIATNVRTSYRVWELPEDGFVDPRAVQISLRRAIQPGHSWGLPSGCLRVLDPDARATIAIEIAQRADVLVQHAAAAAASLEAVAIERARIAELALRQQREIDPAVDA